MGVGVTNVHYFEMAGAALLSAPLFVSTNADDLVLLTIFFSQPNARAVSIVLGQVIGLGALTLASIIVARLAAQLPTGWIPLLGVVPIYLGLRQIFSPSADDDESTGAPPALHWWTVAAVTIANGGDNLGVYIPVFAGQTIAGTIVIGVLFLIFTLLWCALAYGVVRHPACGEKVRSAAVRFGPYVLVVVGLCIAFEHPAIQGWIDWTIGSARAAN